MEEKEYLLDFSDNFLLGTEKHNKSGQKKIVKKLGTLIDEIEEHPTTGTGKPEAMKLFGERNVWSRRIDQKHRLVYEIFEEEKRIEVLSCYGHYDDK